MDLTAAQIDEITRYLDATTPLPERADLIFIFGTRLIEPADLAADLYYQGRAALIAVTGGFNRKTGENEAQAHFRHLIQRGVPAQHVIVEDQSTNTLENVTFALPRIAAVQPLSEIRSVIAICKWMHSRRALMTLKRHRPRGIRYYAQTYAPQGITRENWIDHTHLEGANVLGNWERIPKYLQAGHLEEVVFDGECYI